MMKGPKYELLSTDRVSPAGHPLFQLRALRDFEGVCAGDLGGYVEGEHNLPHDGNAWLYGTATIYGRGYIADFCRLDPDIARVSLDAGVTEGWRGSAFPVEPVRPLAFWTDGGRHRLH